MDTNRIKRFATEARNKLKEGIAAKIRTLGFDKKGNVAEEHRPQLMQGGTHWNGQLLPETFYHQWTSLYNRIQQKGISEVYEEAAYTWFNRLCAIRILQKNDLCAPVLDYTDAARTPFIVDEARQGRIPEMNNEMRSRLSDLLDDDTKVTEQFAVLINAWCHDNPIIHSCFGAMADYTELLLPNNILIEGGFVDMLNHTNFITDADYRSPELIGWLYQFYISERKDEVFAKKGKFEADEIPAATQIFTPNWIVKYMVQNTVGRIYLDNNPYEMQLQKKWQYLVEPSEKPSADSMLKYEELTDLRVADLACGSGHILNECFDLLYDLYIAEGYGRGEAIENIFRHNLT
ncbi:MAG: SAM-dependent methyltransferase, partial [Bacteroides sp.]